MTTITWTKCSESLPDEFATVLIAMDDGKVWTGFVNGGANWAGVDAWPISDGVTVTHWAPLPKHPGEDACA